MQGLPGLPHANKTRVAADAQLKTGEGRIWRIDLYGTSDAPSIKIYDNTSATGTEIIGVVAPFTDADASAAATVSVSYVDIGGIIFTTGAYADITGTNAVAYVWWT